MNEEPVPQSEMILYQTEDGRTRIQCRFDGEMIWLTQGLIAELFHTTKQNVSLHIQNIFEEKELEEAAVVKEYLTTASDGKRYRILHYNLDLIVAVGYRVKSIRGTQFRQWATARLSEYLVKGFTMDTNQFLLYTASDGAIKVEVFYINETVWLTQKAPGVGFSMFHFGTYCRG